MFYLSKEAILGAADRATEDLQVPEWGGIVRISAMSASTRDKWEQEIYGGDKPKMDDFRARFVGLCLVDESGERMFSDSEIASLGRKSAAALHRVFSVAQRLNALDDGAVEDAAKN